MSDRCACGHDAVTQHDEGGTCICCLCPEPHDEVRMVPTLMNGRWELRLPSHRAYRREWTTPPYWEPERLDAMHALIEPGDVVYDVGCEEGDMAGLFASWGAKIVAVDFPYTGGYQNAPDPEPLLRESIRQIAEKGNESILRKCVERRKDRIVCVQKAIEGTPVDWKQVFSK